MSYILANPGIVWGLFLQHLRLTAIALAIALLIALLTHPADPFVGELLGAEDIVRQLSLVRVETAMAPLSAAPPGVAQGDAPAVGCDDDLRVALSTLLRTGAPALAVVADGTPVGVLTLEGIRDAARAGASTAGAPATTG